jgi:hypothetical protein
MRLLLHHPDLYGLINDTPSFARFLLSGDEFHQCGLPAAILPQDCDAFTLIEMKVNIIKKEFDVILFFDIEEIDESQWFFL